VSTLAAQTRPPRSRRKGRSRGPCIYLAYGRSTCAELASRVDTKVSHDDTVEWAESRWRGPSRNTQPMRKRLRATGCGTPYSRLRLHRRACLPASLPTMLPRFRSTHANLRVGESLRCPPSRRVTHKWSGRRPNKYTAAQRPFRYGTRRTCLSSEGGHRRLCAAPPEHRRLCAATSGRRRLCASPLTQAAA
jgi:hypothetical protein